MKNHVSDGPGFRETVTAWVMFPVQMLHGVQQHSTEELRA
jgi:hypothetical protein